MRLALLALASLGSLATTASADIRPPDKREASSVWAPVVIKGDALKGLEAGAKAKIVIPRSLLPAVAEEKPINFEGRPIGGTIIAGIALSLAAVSLLWLRKVKSANRTFLILLAGTLMLGGIGALYADIPGRPGPRPRPAPPKPQIVIEIVEEGETVVLTIPK